MKTLTEIKQIARDTWDYIYLIRKDRFGYWQIILHSPDGPTHYIGENGKIACRCCYRMVRES